MAPPPALLSPPRRAPRTRAPRAGGVALILKCIFVVRAVRAHLAPAPMPRAHAGAESGAGAETSVAGNSTGMATLNEGRRELQTSALGVCSDVRFAGRMTLATGQSHTCAVSTASAVVCWGSNSNGQINAPTSVFSNQVAVSSVWSHACSMSMAGEVTCWGYNGYGQTNVPAFASSNQLAVSAGFYHTCSLSISGTVSCWGYNGFGQTNVPASASSNQVAVSAGSAHTCSLSTTGGITCWGNNGDGQTYVPAMLTYSGGALPCRGASFIFSTPTPTAIPTPGFACAASLYRMLRRMDLVGTPVGEVIWLLSEESCRIACCAASSCQGYSFAFYDTALRMLGAPTSCFLFSNVTQLVPSNVMSSGVLLSSL